TPTTEPTQEPTVTPTTEPTQEPTVTPTTEPTVEPTATPTEELTGSIRATIRNTDDQAINGACIAIDDGNSVCDNTPNDRDPSPGSILVDDVAVGQHSVSVTDFPGTYLQPDPQPATVSANETSTVSFVLQAAPPQTGSAQITFTIDGAPLPDGLCVQVTNTNGGVPYGTFCDGDQNDADATAGVIELQDIPVGIYAVKLTPESQARIDGFKSATTGTLIILANGSDEVTIAIVAEPEPTTGTVEISTRNNSTNLLLGGACYELRPQDDGDTIAVCDNDGAGPDQNGTTGVIRLVDVPAGAYTLVMTTAPAGFTAATNRQIDVTAGVLNQFEVRLDAIPQKANLTVHKIDQNGGPLKNACFQLQQGNVVLQTICDATDDTPSDGSVIFRDLSAGIYQVVETKAPTNDYQLADPVTVRIVAGQNREINVTNVAKTGRLVVTKVDAADVNTILENACFQLKSDNRTYGPYCDDDDGTTDGKIVFGEVVPATYTLIETVSPPGYQKADNREITINPGASVNVTVADRKAPPPAKSGTLIVSKQDDQKRPLPGGCFRLYDGESPVTGQVCDNTDGKNDATIIFNKVPVGTWTLRETLAPSTDYQIAPDRKVTIENGKTTRVAVPNSLKTGRVQVKKTNQNGTPLQGACFDLAPDGKGPRCTDANGSIIFSVAVGTYSLTETTTPTGYVPASKVENIKVKPGQTTVVNVVNKLAPPPPNTGSVQVFKFFCPAAAGGAKTQFLGGAEGNQQLAKTANCNRGNAAFTLKGENGSGGPGAFTTGADGQYQVTVPAGIYTLTETDPDLPGPSSAKLKVVKGQLTTVIVINYVEPPKPAPATIQVTKYTCPSSFNGTLYDDFRQNCSAQTQLTNNVTVRVQGPTPQKHVTGDSGKKGQSTFSGLTAGTYTLSEDRPFNVPVNYIFCGFDGNWPADYKAVNTSLSFDLQSGQTMNCVLFNIPEVPKKDMGTILVHKYVCDVKNPPKGFDFESECRLSDQNAKFSLATYNAETQKFDPPTTGRANPDGLLRFKDLKPGTYQLLEVDGKWCHAKSNSVDSKGNVVVKPNAYSEVWIYNCVEPTSPPNTGSGDAAALLNPGGGNTGTGMLLSVAWPLLAAGAWLAFRNRPHRRALAPQMIRRDADDRRAA
ncbi:MAG TPA: SpaA isopeptide-forming pilin-related protein, partial [Thermomicrobiales bacterium]|nr:SpaA isopeptide-forming pilin-related protein [Thermomicrobiales bacterium]